MHKLTLVFATLALSGALLSSPPARAQDNVDTPPSDSPGSTIGDDVGGSGINQELLDSELGPNDDTPPAAEYPYPGAKEEGIQATQPTFSPKSDKITAAAEPPPPINMEIQRPSGIDKDTGDYYYPRTPQDANEKKYGEDSKAPKFSNQPDIEAPERIEASGQFRYATEKSPTTGTASFRVGFFGPPMLRNKTTGTLFQDIYTKNQLPVLFGDYEVPLTTKIGHLGVKFASGIFVASGQGQFATVDPARRSDDIAQERYTFLMLPNQLTLQYRFQYKDTQPFVPYVEGGAGYFTFTEFRDDSSTPRIGGALTTVIAGGAMFLMDWIDEDAIQRLDADYGINHVFLTLEAREIVGLNKNYDFTGSAFNAGFMLQF